MFLVVGLQEAMESNNFNFTEAWTNPQRDYQYSIEKPQRCVPIAGSVSDPVLRNGDELKLKFVYVSAKRLRFSLSGKTRSCCCHSLAVISCNGYDCYRPKRLPVARLQRVSRVNLKCLVSLSCQFEDASPLLDLDHLCPFSHVTEG
jgi:hypothetical protein